MLIFRILVLVSLVRLLISTNKPSWCAGVYALLAGVGTLVSSGQLTTALIAAGIGFVMSGIYFWLLNRFSEGILWWVILIAGLLIGLV